MVREQADIISENEIKKSVLMSEALNQLSLLQDAIELGIQQEGDEPRLKAWKTYRIQLSRVDTTIENIAFPPQPTN